MVKKGPARKSVASRVSERTTIAGDCLVYMGTLDKDGYGQIGVGRGCSKRVTRALWEEVRGPLPAGMLLCHTCDNPPCVNLDHLFVGTPKDNTADMLRKGRRRDDAGERHPMHKLTYDQVEDIRRRLSSGEFLRVIAADYGICIQTVSLIHRGLAWTR